MSNNQQILKILETTIDMLNKPCVTRQDYHNISAMDLLLKQNLDSYTYELNFLRSFVRDEVNDNELKKTCLNMINELGCAMNSKNIEKIIQLCEEFPIKNDQVEMCFNDIVVNLI